ncbi:hypothetical protein [Nocardia sp. NPDC051570]|uniref:hypothetical protein n=1 Tax=Nocardia sp. NPDC051570 TaxID=3364324 RepID=UPI003799D777
METPLPIVSASSAYSLPGRRPDSDAARGSRPRVVEGIATPESSTPLEAATTRILLAAAEGVTGLRPLRGHYERYYRHRAARSPHYAQAYTAFANTTQGAALRIARQDFTSLAIPGRRHLLQLIRMSPNGQQFEDVFFQETLAIFLKTDAWLQLGYQSWEGSARGLDSYRRRA